MSSQSVIIDSLWDEFLQEEIESEYFKQLIRTINDSYNNERVFPPRELLFEAFRLCKPYDVKVVILGQDPYHEVGQACGLAFSVPFDCKFPPSLKNLIKELESDILANPDSFISYNQSREALPKSVLEPWARQGVLLLNSILSVAESEPLSHRNFGWERFTDAIIARLSQLETPIVFILLGNFAISKSRIIRETLVEPDSKLILTGAHPSPLSATRGFFGGNYFSKTNDFLYKNKVKKIDWSIDFN